MQTEEDKQIQSNLENAGKGLPSIETLLLKHVVFPLLKTTLSWNMGMKLFEAEGEKILHAVKQLDHDILFKKVLIPRILGIEDNSRYYSPAMVLWHLIYVGNAIQAGIVGLSKNESVDFVVKIENFKPFVEISDNIVNEYELFLHNYRSDIENNIQNKYIKNYHAHPWFGPLNPHQWLVMSAVHQIVHGRQLRKILATS
jgi:hypothetical protein